MHTLDRFFRRFVRFGFTKKQKKNGPGQVSVMTATAAPGARFGIGRRPLPARPPPAPSPPETPPRRRLSLSASYASRSAASASNACAQSASSADPSPNISRHSGSRAEFPGNLRERPARTHDAPPQRRLQKRGERLRRAAPPPPAARRVRSTPPPPRQDTRGGDAAGIVVSMRVVFSPFSPGADVAQALLDGVYVLLAGGDERLRVCPRERAANRGGSRRVRFSRGDIERAGCARAPPRPAAFVARRPRFQNLQLILVQLARARAGRVPRDGPERLFRLERLRLDEVAPREPKRQPLRFAFLGQKRDEGVARGRRWRRSSATVRFASSRSTVVSTAFSNATSWSYRSYSCEPTRSAIFRRASRQVSEAKSIPDSGGRSPDSRRRPCPPRVTPPPPRSRTRSVGSARDTGPPSRDRPRPREPLGVPRVLRQVLGHLPEREPRRAAPERRGFAEHGRTSSGAAYPRRASARARASSAAPGTRGTPSCARSRHLRR